MINSGKYDKYIEILQDVESNEADELGGRSAVPTKVGDTFARKEDRVGSLLTGRAADTVVSTTTHKFSYPCLNFPDLTPRVHYIKYNNVRYDVDYIIDDESGSFEMQAFVTVRR